MRCVSTGPSGLRLLSRPQEQQAGGGDERLDSCLTQTWQPCPHRPVSVAAHRAESGTGGAAGGDTFAHIYQAPGERLFDCPIAEHCTEFSKDGGKWCPTGTWEAKAEDPEQNHSFFKVCTLS